MSPQSCSQARHEVSAFREDFLFQRPRRVTFLPQSSWPSRPTWSVSIHPFVLSPGSPSNQHCPATNNTKGLKSPVLPRHPAVNSRSISDTYHPTPNTNTVPSPCLWFCLGGPLESPLHAVIPGEAGPCALESKAEGEGVGGVLRPWLLPRAGPLFHIPDERRAPKGEERGGDTAEGLPPPSGSWVPILTLAPGPLIRTPLSDFLGKGRNWGLTQAT